MEIVNRESELEDENMKAESEDWNKQLILHIPPHKANDIIHSKGKTAIGNDIIHSKGETAIAMR